MHLFLQGRSKIGKSTILREALLPRQNEVAGFAVQRLTVDGRPAGFRACVVDGRLPKIQRPWEEGLTGVFMTRGFLSQAVLDKVIFEARDVCARESCKLILLDEIGGVELLSEPFMRSLTALLDSGKPCIGVIKSHKNLSNTARRLKNANVIFAARDRLHEKNLENGQVLTMTEENYVEIQKEVEAFVERIFPPEI